MKHWRMSRTHPGVKTRLWSHNFFCLASKNVRFVPSLGRKEELLAAGLGEKRVKVMVNATAAQLHEALLEAFTLLKEGGGYEFLRCLPNSRTLVPIEVPSHGHTPCSLRNDVGQARVYLRPFQVDLKVNRISNEGAISQVWKLINFTNKIHVITRLNFIGPHTNGKIQKVPC